MIRKQSNRDIYQAERPLNPHLFLPQHTSQISVISPSLVNPTIPSVVSPDIFSRNDTRQLDTMNSQSPKRKVQTGPQRDTTILKSQGINIVLGSDKGKTYSNSKKL